MIHYTVQSGDTLWSIAQTFRVPIEDLIRYNNIEDENEIWAGSTLIIPKRPYKYPKWHIVKPGESMYSIANMHGIPLDVLISMNPISDINYIYPGQVIRLRW